MIKINPSKALFIKLGKGGEWFNKCNENGYIQLGYHEVAHIDIMKGNYSVIPYAYQGKSKKVISSYETQIKHFYESDDSVLWITFHNEFLWWAFAEKNPYSQDSEKGKFKKTINGWSNQSLAGDKLRVEDLSGNLIKIQGFQGTICIVDDFEYLVRKINGEEIPEVSLVRNNVKDLKQSIGQCIKKLTPKDFELLIDLIFRQAGYLRINTIGGPQKTKDIELLSPITEERILIQVKSSTDKNQILKYRFRFSELEG